jgi:RHS repeat-associated protein
LQLEGSLFNRYYSNAYGRFMTPDPYKVRGGGPGDTNNPQSWNRYAYVLGHPLNWIDPQGLDNCDPGDPLPCTVTITGNNPDGGGGTGSGGGSNPCQGLSGGFYGSYELCMAQVAWQNCYNAVQQQQDAPAQQMLQFLDAWYPQILAGGAVIGGILGGIVGTTVDEFIAQYGTLGGIYFGSHLGALSANEWHTLAVLTLSVLSSLPPIPSSVTANCGPNPN